MEMEMEMERGVTCGGRGMQVLGERGEEGTRQSGGALCCGNVWALAWRPIMTLTTAHSMETSGICGGETGDRMW